MLVFGSPALLKEDHRIKEIRQRYPEAYLFGCSTGGEIYGTQVYDDTLTVTAVRFAVTTFQHVEARIEEHQSSQAVGEYLAKKLEIKELKHVLVLSDGTRVNGSELVTGLTKCLPSHIAVTGGLAGDGANFQETVILSEREVAAGKVVALGLYGDQLKVGYSSLGGWDVFGAERLVTRAQGNVLYELDGKSALQLYKKYLGEHAQGLPATALLFPLSLRRAGDEASLVRTVLSINEEEESMTFAGDLPEGAYVRFMKANFDRLVDGANAAAVTSYQAGGSVEPELAILVSCIGRKLVLKQRIEEEVESVRDVLGEHTTITGFYSYGEISPFTPGVRCELHNQTMAITTFAEVE